jgi:hypothetical protein
MLHDFSASVSSGCHDLKTDPINRDALTSLCGLTKSLMNLWVIIYQACLLQKLMLSIVAKSQWSLPELSLIQSSVAGIGFHEHICPLHEVSMSMCFVHFLGLDPFFNSLNSCQISIVILLTSRHAIWRLSLAQLFNSECMMSKQCQRGESRYCKLTRGIAANDESFGQAEGNKMVYLLSVIKK